jgi:hypothetical protein
LIADTALKEVGYHEGTNNSNKFSQSLKKLPQSWCADFVVWCAIQGQQGDVVLHSSYCPDFEAWAIKNKLTVPIESVKRNDLLLFDWTHSGTACHIGIATGDYNKANRQIPTVEGNTGKPGMNQSNGDGVYTKTRDASLVRLAIRPKWRTA